MATAVIVRMRVVMIVLAIGAVDMAAVVRLDRNGQRLARRRVGLPVLMAVIVVLMVMMVMAVPLSLIHI